MSGPTNQGPTDAVSGMSSSSDTIQLSSNLMQPPAFGDECMENQAMALDVITSASKSSSELRAAAAALWSEDERLQHFLHLLTASNSQNSNEHTNHTLKDYQRRQPTVPTALSRRILHKQGAGYLDSAVASVASAAADRFLATVIHQSVICRDRRIQGEEILQRNRKQFIQLQKLKMKERELKRKKMQRIDQVLDSLQKPTEGSIMRWLEENKEVSATNNVTSPPSSTTGGKKRSNAALSTSSSTLSNTALSPEAMKNSMPISVDQLQEILDDAQALFDENNDQDSIDDEEAYYERLYTRDETIGTDLSSNMDGASSDEDDDSEVEIDPSRFVLQLRDLARPLEAWGVNLLGKLGMTSSFAIPVSRATSEGDSNTAMVRDEDNRRDTEIQEDDLFTSARDKKNENTEKKVRKKRSPKKETNNKVSESITPTHEGTAHSNNTTTIGEREESK